MFFDTKALICRKVIEAVEIESDLAVLHGNLGALCMSAGYLTMAIHHIDISIEFGKNLGQAGIENLAGSPSQNLTSPTRMPQLLLADCCPAWPWWIIACIFCGGDRIGSMNKFELTKLPETNFKLAQKFVAKAFVASRGPCGENCMRQSRLEVTGGVGWSTWKTCQFEPLHKKSQNLLFISDRKTCNETPFLEPDSALTLLVFASLSWLFSLCQADLTTTN